MAGRQRHTVRRSDCRGHAVPGRFARHGADAGRPHHSHDGSPRARRAARPPRHASSSSPKAIAPTASSAANRGSTFSSIASATSSACASWSRRSCARSATCRPPSPTGERCDSAQSKSHRKSRRQPPPAGANEVHEIKALLEWMADNHFTFLGYREYRLRRGRSEDVLEPLPDTGLGILRVRRGIAGRADGADRRGARACARSLSC